MPQRYQAVLLEPGNATLSNVFTDTIRQRIAGLDLDPDSVDYLIGLRQECLCQLQSDGSSHAPVHHEFKSRGLLNG